MFINVIVIIIRVEGKERRVVVVVVPKSMRQSRLLLNIIVCAHSSIHQISK